MNNQAEQQIIESLKKARRVLIALPHNANGDAIGAGLALFGFLKKLDKDVDIASAADNLDQYAFLPDSQAIKTKVTALPSFVISVSTKNAELDDITTEQREGQFDIYLHAKQGRFSEGDVTFHRDRFPYDLIVTLSTPNLDALGWLYESNTDLFFETPVVNLDHHPNNQYYGEINHVDLAATSTAEILSNLINNFESSLIDGAIATNLLAGIIVETNSFQHIKTTPRSFLRASDLIAKGGDHQQVIRELYKTKSMPTLKLWGRALARLREDKDLGLTYSLVNKADLEKTESDEGDVYTVMKELVATLTGSKILIFIAETAPGKMLGYFYVHPGVNAEVLTASLSGRMLNGQLGMFSIEADGVLSAEKVVLERLQKAKGQLNI